MDTLDATGRNTANDAHAATAKVVPAEDDDDDVLLRDELIPHPLHAQKKQISVHGADDDDDEAAAARRSGRSAAVAHTQSDSIDFAEHRADDDDSDRDLQRDRVIFEQLVANVNSDDEQSPLLGSVSDTDNKRAASSPPSPSPLAQEAWKSAALGTTFELSLHDALNTRNFIKVRKRFAQAKQQKLEQEREHACIRVFVCLIGFFFLFHTSREKQLKKRRTASS